MARSFEKRGSLAGLWVSDKNRAFVRAPLFKRCWPFHLVMKTFYHTSPQIVIEKMFYVFFPLWRLWIKSQPLPQLNVVQAILGYGSELFAKHSSSKVLKVADCPNSHPVTFFGFWQRECDLWCPGEKVPIPQWMFARMTRELELADLIIVQSSFCRDSMALNGIPEKKIFINPMGVDTDTFKPRHVIPTKPKFICVGTICLRKGHQYLFRAFASVKSRLPNAELICVGQYKTDFRKERKKWEGTFTHIPHLSHKDLSSLLQTCTAFVFPSQEEGIARAQVEALASGLPVIGTHEGGATTLIRDGVEGFIVHGRDPQNIADAMIRIFLDPNLNHKMGKAAFAKGGLKNTWQDYGDRLLEKYVQLLNS